MRGELLLLLDSDSTEPWDRPSMSWSLISSRWSEALSGEAEGDLALPFVLADLLEFEEDLGGVMVALHMGQFCLIFSQGSTHFL